MLSKTFNRHAIRRWHTNQKRQRCRGNNDMSGERNCRSTNIHRAKEDDKPTNPFSLFANHKSKRSSATYWNHVLKQPRWWRSVNDVVRKILSEDSRGTRTLESHKPMI